MGNIFYKNKYFNVKKEMIMRNNNFGNSINNRIKVTPNRERSQNCKR